MDGVSSFIEASGGKGSTGARMNIPRKGLSGWGRGFTTSGTSKDSI